ncbi:MAG: Leucine aminopeptidase-related protein [Candidatus Ozemobacter sibiricus]|uniref:Leucine aminopeptidase-related protein n=1 Tax=Candidatus Ozemobacter sibiricus TaxID=2268124 RepID=A0A367ZWG9_9BACT|nr:MAG: Leucine aminopeptidase-related protein [Candidatus Ozemobacter sibiricus]
MARRWLASLLAIGFLALPLAGLALSGEPKAEFDEFVRTLREDRRLDRIGYVVEVKLPLSKANETKIFAYAGKYFYASPDGYLTHVNHARLDRMQKAKLDVRIIDKKRLDDAREAWYLVWVGNEAEDRVLRDRFEPLFAHSHTRLIRIRPEDEDYLQFHGLRYSLVEEELLPLKTPPMTFKSPRIDLDPKIAELLPLITKEDMAATVKRLEDCVSRQVRAKGNAEAVEWLAAQFQQMPGLEVSTPTFSYSTKPLSNVVAIQKGVKDPSIVFVVIGHLDSTVGWSSSGGQAPGADDNGSGAAGVLHIASVASTLALPYTVIYCCANAEEVGLVGSKALARQLAAASGQTVKAVLNLDMIADRDDNQVAVIGNTRSNWLIDVFKDVARLYTGLESKCLYNSDIWYSDHSSFWNIGVPAILTIEGYPEMSPHYHKVTDTVANLSPALMERVARANLATLLTLNAEPRR